MLRYFKLILVTLNIAWLISATSAEAFILLPCVSDDHKCAAEELAQSPIKKMPYWKSAFRQPVEKRIGSAPRELVVHLNLDNIVAGFPNKPEAATLSEDFLKDVNDAFAEMPEQVKKLLSKRLAGIYFVSDLGGTGYTDYIYGGKPGSDAGFIVLDVDVLSKSTANTWATWKERTPFIADPQYHLDAIIENDAQNNRKNAIQYILLHEIGHILSIGENIHPRWDQPKSNFNLEHFPFAYFSWDIGNPDDMRYISRFEKQFTLRKSVMYYFGALLNADQMVAVYDQLKETNFPTLYAATYPGDDFAESFVSYVHTVMLKRPLEIRIYRDGIIAKTYVSCWEETRCAAKREFLDKLLK